MGSLWTGPGRPLLTMNEQMPGTYAQLEVSFMLTNEERRRFRKLFKKPITVGAAWRWIYRGIMLTVLVGVAAWNVSTFGVWGIKPLIPAIAIIGFGIAARVVAIYRRRENNVMVTVQLTETALIQRTAASKIEVPWSTITAVRTVGWATLMYTSPVRAYIVPNRAFSDPKLAARFAQWATYYQDVGRTVLRYAPVPSSGEGLSVTYVCSRDDAVHAHWYLLRTANVRRTLLGIAVRVGIAAAYFASCRVLWPNYGGGVNIVINTVFPLVFGAYLLWVGITPRNTLRSMTAKPDSFQQMTISVQREGLRQVTVANTVDLAWSRLTSVRSDARLVYFLSPVSGGSIFLPRAAFPNSTAADHFVATATAYLRGAEPPAALPAPVVWPPPPSVR